MTTYRLWRKSNPPPVHPGTDPLLIAASDYENLLRWRAEQDRAWRTDLYVQPDGDWYNRRKAVLERLISEFDPELLSKPYPQLSIRHAHFSAQPLSYWKYLRLWASLLSDRLNKVLGTPTLTATSCGDKLFELYDLKPVNLYVYHPAAFSHQPMDLARNLRNNIPPKRIYLDKARPLKQVERELMERGCYVQLESTGRLDDTR